MLSLIFSVVYTQNYLFICDLQGMHIPNSRSGISLINFKLVGVLDMQGTPCLIDLKLIGNHQLKFKRTSSLMILIIHNRKHSIIGTRFSRPTMHGTSPTSPHLLGNELEEQWNRDLMVSSSPPRKRAKYNKGDASFMLNGSHSS